MRLGNEYDVGLMFTFFLILYFLHFFLFIII
jgi:hypothetical protein